MLKFLDDFLVVKKVYERVNIHDFENAYGSFEKVGTVYPLISFFYNCDQVKRKLHL